MELPSHCGGDELQLFTNKKRKAHTAYSVALTPKQKAERKKQAQEPHIQQEY